MELTDFIADWLDAHRDGGDLAEHPDGGFLPSRVCCDQPGVSYRGVAESKTEGDHPSISQKQAGRDAGMSEHQIKQSVRVATFHPRFPAGPS